MEWIVSLLALLLGALLGWFLGERRSSRTLTLERQHLAEFERTKAEELTRLQTLLSIQEKQLEDIKLLLQEKEGSIGKYQQEASDLFAQLSALKTIETHLREKISQQLEEATKQEERLRTEFANLANTILRKNTTDLTTLNKDNLTAILTPLKEQIDRFEKRVNDLDSQGAERHGQLRTELEKLRELNTNLQAEAGNLTRALKGDTKSQGNWGELVLDKVLEVSGLIPGREYRKQAYITGSEGERASPDVIVDLPEQKHIIIDSKVSLTAYENYVNAEEEEARAKALQQHIQSVRNHIRLLSDKKYQSSEQLDSPDFVLMFMPVEPAFSLAMREKPELFNEAWERKIVIVSPTTLLATLRTVASIWKHEKQTQNAMEIARAGGGLYDKFSGLLEDLIRVGNQLDTTRKTYDDAMNKLQTGKGNLIRRVEQLKELGVKVSKGIPTSLLNNDDSLLENEVREDEI